MPFSPLRPAALLSVLLLAAGPAAAQMALSPERSSPEKTVPLSKGEIQLSFAPVVKRAAPSVVNVYATHVEKRSARSSAMDEFMRRFFGEDRPGRGPSGLPGERAQRSLGSGVIVDGSGLVIT
ncbi:MAG: serine protease, partial [Methylorubrum rhodinum]